MKHYFDPKLIWNSDSDNILEDFYKHASATLNKNNGQIHNDKFSDGDRLRRDMDLNRSIISQDKFNEIKSHCDLIIIGDGHDTVLDKLKNL